MTMLPFGPCLRLWRLHRGLSQAALAQKAGLPRPNLSDIERGRREVSLRTLRALALALDLRPGILADGTGPIPLGGPLSRAGLERVAEAAAQGRPLPDPSEKELAEDLALLSPRAPKGRKSGEAWLRLASSRDPAEIRSLAERFSEKARP